MTQKLLMSLRELKLSHYFVFEGCLSFMNKDFTIRIKGLLSVLVVITGTIRRANQFLYNFKTLIWHIFVAETANLKTNKFHYSSTYLIPKNNILTFQ